MNTRTVITQVDQTLGPLGFAREGATWNRRFGSFVDVIDIQVSKTDNTVTVNAGVTEVEVHEKFGGTELPAIVEEPFCIVRTRVGHLIDEKDKWWSLTDAHAIADIAETIVRKVLPYLEHMHTHEAMENELIAAQTTKQIYPPSDYLSRHPTMEAWGCRWRMHPPAGT